MSFIDQGHITHLKRIAGAVTTPAPFRALPHIETGAAWLFIGVLVFQIVILARHAFELRYGDDAAMLYYMAFLINEHDYLPYRDIHETSFPGTFLLYGLITKITGYSVLAFNVTHMLVLGLFGAASVLLLKKINLRMAIAATCAFGSSYFFMNKAMFMQRDFFVLILTLYAMLAMTSEWRLATRSIITGLLLALASSIKPHVILAAPIVVLSGATLHHAGFSLRTMFQAAWIALASFFAFWAVLIAVMVITGCWDAFYDMATEYLPLYQRMNGIHVTQSLDVRLKNLVNPCITLIACGLLSMAVWRQKITPLIAAIAATFLTLGYITEKRANPQQDFLFLLEWIPVVYGIVLVCFMAHCTEKKRKLIIALLLLRPIFLLYVAIAGKNWDYHQMPALYFYACLLCLAFIPFYIETWKTFGFRLLYLAIMVFALRGYVGPDYALVDACMTKDPGCGQPEKLQDAQEDRLETFFTQPCETRTTRGSHCALPVRDPDACYVASQHPASHGVY